MNSKKLAVESLLERVSTRKKLAVESLLEGMPEYAKYTKAKLLEVIADFDEYCEQQRRNINTQRRIIEMLEAAAENINKSSGTK